MKYNLKKQRAWHKGNFTMLHNEILFYRDKNGNPLDGDTLSIFWRLMSLPDDWDLSIRGLQKITGFGSQKITRCLNELFEIGYLQSYKVTKDGKFMGYMYYLKEVLNEELWYTCQDPEVVNIENECRNNPLCENVEKNDENVIDFYDQNPSNSDISISEPCPDFPVSGFSGSGKSIYGKPWTIKNINNKEKNYKEKKKINKINSSSKEEEVLLCLDNSKNISSRGSLDNCSMENLKQEKISHGTCSSKNSIPRINKQDKAPQENFLDFMQCQDPINKPKQKVKVKKVKNKVQQMEMEKNDSISTLDTMGYKNTIGKLTDVDNELSRAIKSSNEILALEKRVNMANMKKLSNKKTMTKYINQIVPDAPIQSAMGDFLEMYVNKFGVLSKPALKLLYEDLIKLSDGDVEKQKEIINNAVKNQWKQFYVTNANKQSTTSQTQTNPINPRVNNIFRQDQPVEEEQDATNIIATDENGNPISF